MVDKSLRGMKREKTLKLISKGPLGVYVDTNALNFKDYKIGVMSGDSDCKERNHAVIFIGIDRDAYGEYFILRNSHWTYLG
jgi:hypothetical protein